MPNPIFASTLSDLADRDTLLSMSGLAFMEAIRDGTLPNPPIAKTLNYHVESVDDGRVVFRGAPLFDHFNPVGTVHGGWYGTLLDSCMACAVMTKVPKGSVYTTLEYKVNITRPIPLGTEIVAEGIVSHSGRSTGVAEGTIRGAEDGKLYATGSTTCIIMLLPDPAQKSCFKIFATWPQNLETRFWTGTITRVLYQNSCNTPDFVDFPKGLGHGRFFNSPPRRSP